MPFWGLTERNECVPGGLPFLLLLSEELIKAAQCRLFRDESLRKTAFAATP